MILNLKNLLIRVSYTFLTNSSYNIYMHKITNLNHEVPILFCRIKFEVANRTFISLKSLLNSWNCRTVNNSVTSWLQSDNESSYFNMVLIAMKVCVCINLNKTGYNKYPKKGELRNGYILSTEMSKKGGGIVFLLLTF